MFDSTHRKRLPLAERLRPQSFAEMVGQESLTSSDSPLMALILSEGFQSLIFWGPPGTGKTSLARTIGNKLQRPVALLSAVSAGAKDLRQAIESSSRDVLSGHRCHLIFVDEVHRFNKAQQDILLPAIESGHIKLIGATTENPSFEVNRAILSRSLVFSFSKLSHEAIRELLLRGLALENEQTDRQATLDNELTQVLCEVCAGDGRRAVNLLSSLLLAFPSQSVLGLEHLQKLGVDVRVYHDKKGDSHYDVASAMIKSIRAGQVDAALHYMARLIEGGEDPMFIARRLMISASEDIGNANPHGIMVATAAAEAVHRVGLPEARIILSQACCFLATSKKSNRAYLAIDQALEDVRRHPNLHIPMELRNAPTQLMKSHGYGKGYVYAHDDPEGAKTMQYLPDGLEQARYYRPSSEGYEAKLPQS